MTLQARYTILRKIADGGTAEIFLATQHGAHGFEKPVVLKRIFPAFYADPQFRNMLVDEAHIAMSLNHSNIVQVLDLGEADGQYVLALELVDGWTLDAVLRRARALKTSVPPALALYMAAEVCRALAYAHAKAGADEKPLGIVHRDISPHNVLLSEQGEVKLTDFGIAKARNRRESSVGHMIKGKIAYMSPEQASATELDARSDLFSMGTMLYVMVCRRYPFDAPTDLEVLLLVKNGEYEPPEKALPGLNPEIYRVINRAMAKSPGDRYQRAEEMLIDVEQVMRVGFRAVGQTELKRWLQDLSMRDGVPPLTRTPPSPSLAAAGRLDGETLELKGVGTTLPPPAGGRAPGMPQAPVRAGAPNKGRPPPPPAAMAVGKPTTKVDTRPAAGAVARPLPPIGSSRLKGATGVGPPSGAGGVTEQAGPDTLAAEEAEKTPEGVSELLAPAALDAATLTPPPQERPGAGHHLLPTGTPAPHTPQPTKGEERTSGRVGQPPGSRAVRAVPAAARAGGGPTDALDAAATEKSLRKSGSFELPAPVPRKSSSWVAEAVLASAQRAGTAPPPPVVGNNVPPPPVSGLPAGRDVPPPPQAEVLPANTERPPMRGLLTIGSGVGIAALILFAIFARRCGDGSNENVPRAAEQTPTPGVATTIPPPPAPPVPGPSRTTTGSPGSNVAAPVPAAPAPEGASAVPPARSTAETNVAAGNRGTPSASENTDGAAAPVSGGLGGGAAVRADDSSPSAASVSASTPPTRGGIPGSASGPARRGEAVAQSGGVADVLGGAAAAENTPAGGSAELPRGAGGTDLDPDTETPTTAPGAKVLVHLSSSPAGAQVGTARRSFGATPVAVKLKVGRTYALVFSRPGYRPVTKQFRVTNFADQQVNAILRREEPEKTLPPPALTQPAAQKPQGNWLQRMFR